MRGSSRFRKDMWRNFPSDILEKVGTFLPIASLCQFRTVSKKWNKLISHPGFATLCAQASSPEEYVLITVRYDHPLNSMGWEVLELANKRFITLTDDFLTKYVKQEGIVSVSDLWNERATLPADGGLFCVSYTVRKNNDSEKSSVLLVCNPVLKTVKQLPHLAGWVERSQVVVMTTDRFRMEYEIIVNIHDDDKYLPSTIHVYESKTAGWRIASNVSPMQFLFSSWREWYPTSIFVKNELYKVFSHRTHNDHHQSWILSYDKVTGVVSEPGVDLARDDLGDNLQLVVSQDRLFCVIMDFFPPCLEIFEIILARKECTRITKMPRKVLKWVLLDGLGVDGRDIEDEEPIVATGCANSILICSYAGRSVTYSLSNQSWRHYPDNSLGEAFKYNNSNHQELHGSYCLRLCAP